MIDPNYEAPPFHALPLSPQAKQELEYLKPRMRSSAYGHYLSLEDAQDSSAGWLLWHEEMIAQSPRSSYQLAAGSCAVEAALHAGTAYPRGLQDRQAIIQLANSHWKAVFAKEKSANNDLAERAKWSMCQVPTYDAIACFMEKGTVADGAQKEQERRFREYFSFILQRWDQEPLDGHSLESLTAYFAHRSNKLRPAWDSPLYSLPSPVRDDHHTQEDRRVDVDIFDLARGMKYGVQVKGGRLSDPYRHQTKKRRIFFNDARRLLCIPYTDNSIRRTVEAIVTDDWQHRDALDTIAADHRARLLRHIILPEYIGTPIVRATEVKK